MRGTLIFSLILAILAVVFALANPQEMDVNLLFAEVQGSTALVVILTLVIGVIIGLLSTVPAVYKERKKRKMLERGEDPAATKEKKSSPAYKSSKRSASASDEPPPHSSESPPPSSSGRPKGTPLGRESDPDEKTDT